jgi:DNA adenine methylase
MSLDKKSEKHVGVGVKLSTNTCLDELLKYDDLNKEMADNNGKTVLMHAAFNNDVPCLTKLIEKGATRNKKDHDGKTALMEAAYWGHLGCVNYLLNNGADRYISDNNGHNALWWAKKRNPFPRVVPTNKQKCARRLIKLQKPFLKWVGGKTQIINTVMEKFPSTMHNYHEPFIGGGSVLLALLTLKNAGDVEITGGIYAYDLNERLINLYKFIQTEHVELHKKVSYYMNVYDSISGDVINRNPANIEDAKTSKESYYYWIRKKFNTLPTASLETAALFLVINKTCFRGMYREGPNGYNIPYGHYKKTPRLIALDELSRISSLLQDVIFECSSFQNMLNPSDNENLQGDDFVYLDPPYVPVDALSNCASTTPSFVGYTSKGFNTAAHEELFERVCQLQDIDVSFVMSNSKTQLVEDAFDEDEYDITYITARRAINSKDPGSTAKEVIVSSV